LKYYGENNEEIASQVAYFFEIGRDYQKASDYFLIATKHAFQIFATHEAVNLGKLGITNAEKLKGKDKTSRLFKISMQLFEVYVLLNDFTNSIEIFKFAEKVSVEEKNIIGIIFSNLAMLNIYFMIHDFK
jgi:hypothetical protein